MWHRLGVIHLIIWLKICGLGPSAKVALLTAPYLRICADDELLSLVEVGHDQLTMPLRIYARSARLLISRHCLKEKVKDSARLNKGFGNRSSTRGHNVRSTACSSLQLTKPHVHTAYFHFEILS